LPVVRELHDGLPDVLLFFRTEVRDLTTGVSNASAIWDSVSIPISATSQADRSVEASDRYRQWLTHKLGTWHEQFGSSGCVGCGRCITWCPVGIDLTEEVAALRESPTP
jgi:ferredoxin